MAFNIFRQSRESVYTKRMKACREATDHIGVSRKHYDRAWLMCREAEAFFSAELEKSYDDYEARALASYGYSYTMNLGGEIMRQSETPGAALEMEEIADTALKVSFMYKFMDDDSVTEEMVDEMVRQNRRR